MWDVIELSSVPAISVASLLVVAAAIVSVVVQPRIGSALVGARRDAAFSS